MTGVQTGALPICEVWQAVAASEAGRNAVRSAERILGEPIPPFTEETYKAIVASGSRADHNFYYARRPGTLASLVIAECCEDQGRFLPRLEELIGSFAGKTPGSCPCANSSPSTTGTAAATTST